jgi:hypothetical protein
MGILYLTNITTVFLYNCLLQIRIDAKKKNERKTIWCKQEIIDPFPDIRIVGP